MVILWYLLIAFIGWLTFPLAYRCTPALADRGYCLSRALGLLLWGYVFWLLASLGILKNHPGGLLLALALVGLASILAMRNQSFPELRNWVIQNLRLIGSVELVFALAFFAYAGLRAAHPEAVGTEKPMELAFINAILGSTSFPPHDPWLSGYAISYYYFGYLVVAMLARLTEAGGGLAFNLGIILVFALTASGAYGLVYNLLARKMANQEAKTGQPNFLAPALGPVFVLLVSNLEGFLHTLHSRGLFWQTTASGQWVSAFWQWLDIEDLNQPPPLPLTWVPNRFWWWWRASRVVRDYDLIGQPREIINEFPFFSYLLADLHPHVLAMPFGLLAIALALNLSLGGAHGRLSGLPRKFNLRTLTWAATLGIPAGATLAAWGSAERSLAKIALALVLLLAGSAGLFALRRALAEHGLEALWRVDLGEIPLGRPIYLDSASFGLTAVVMGGMAFMNTWDFPMYLALFAGAYALLRYSTSGGGPGSLVKDFAWLGACLGITGILLYLPFYLGFASQAGGVLPNLIYPTRGAHLWVMFAPLLLPILGYILDKVRWSQDRQDLRTGLVLAGGLTGFLGLLALLLGAALVLTPQVRDLFLGALAASNPSDPFTEALLRRLMNPGGWLTLFTLLALAAAALAKALRPLQPLQEPGASPELEVAQTAPAEGTRPAQVFVLWLVLLGSLLVYGVEFFYLRDQFGWRINSIFKFYFQAWLLWSIAAAYASARLLATWNSRRGAFLRLGWSFLVFLSLVYPILSTWNNTNGFKPPEWTLDSTAYLQRSAPDDLAAAQWLQTAPFGVLAEAVPPGGGSYTQFGRISMLSGMPAVLGWIGHESQWRGGAVEIGSRQGDLERLYCGRDWAETRAILDRYQVRYVIIGQLERVNYQPGQAGCPTGLIENKFQRYLSLVFRQGTTMIYEYLQ